MIGAAAAGPRVELITVLKQLLKESLQIRLTKVIRIIKNHIRYIFDSKQYLDIIDSYLLSPDILNDR